MSHPIDHLADADARRAIRTELDTSLVVEAAAGTGKTTELVARIIAVLRSGRGTLAEMVSVTFTEKAAGEMRLRLRERLEQVRREPDIVAEEQRRFDRALGELEAARIGTIHALCTDILHERPVEAQVDPVFGVGADGPHGSVFDQAFNGWFQSILENPPEGVRRLLRRPSGPRSSPRESLRAAGWRLAENRDFTAAWTRPDFDREAAIDAIVPRLEGLGDRLDVAFDDTDYLSGNLREIRRFCAELEARERGGSDGDIVHRDYDGIEAQLSTLARHRSWRWRGRGRYFGPGLLRDEVMAERDEVKSALDELLEQCQADLAACLREDLKSLVAAYEELKARAGELDFLDLLVRTRTLVRDDHGVRQQLQRRFSHIFVDEFQDTDPLQAEILMLLAADDPGQADWRDARPVPGKLFVVGDPKQSIYRFRRADVALYTLTRDRLVAHGVKLVHLSTSFRSVPGIQRCVNRAFAPIMTGGLTQAAYVALDEARSPAEGQPEVVVLPVPEPYSDYGKVTNWAVDQSLPPAVARYVRWLVSQSQWTVEEGGERVPIAPRHICLLFRRFQSFGSDVTRPYVSGLERAGVPHVLVGGHSFHGRDEVLAVRNALTAIEWPSDTLSVYATLRGPFFAVADDALLAFRHARGHLNPLRKPPEDEEQVAIPLLAEVEAALAVLRDLHYERNRRPVADTISLLLEATRAHAGLAVWPAGEQALANVLRMTDIARRYESGEATSFRGFVLLLQREADRGDAGDAPIVEEGTEGVRIMTVHKAKGLEFPVVILCDPTARMAHDRPSLHVDNATGTWAAPLAGCMPVELLEHADESIRRDTEESVRVAYVAATRARDLLVVPACGDDRLSGWYEPLNEAVYPPLMVRKNAQPAPGCPEFGQDSVAKRPARARANPATSVAPGLHALDGGLDVVWWDPAVLPSVEGGLSGLRHPRILEQDDAGVADESVAAFDAWTEAREEVLAAGATPGVSVVTPTVLAKGDDNPETTLRPATHAVALEFVDGDREKRPHGKRFGTLVHAVLADADPSATDLQAETERMARAHGRLLLAPDDEVQAAAKVAEATFAHETMQRASAADVCYREHPVTAPLDDGRLMEGIIDLVFREKDQWTVVDFKTDLGLTPESRAAYERQVSAYCAAIEAATGQTATGVILQV